MKGNPGNTMLLMMYMQTTLNRVKEETQQKETAETPYMMTVDTKTLWPTRNTFSNKKEVP